MEKAAEKLHYSTEDIEALSRYVLNSHTDKYSLQSTVSCDEEKYEINSEVILDNLASLFGYEVDYVREKKPSHHGFTDFSEKRIIIYNNDNHATIKSACAHELFHLLIHRKFYEDYGYILKHCAHPYFFESNAKLFSRILLTPPNHFIWMANSFIEKHTSDGSLLDIGKMWDIFQELASFFRVAGRTAGIRLKQLFPKYAQLAEDTLQRYKYIFPKR